jgi:hypothetical protein
VAWGQFARQRIGLLQGEDMSTIDTSTLDSLADRIREAAARRGSESTEDLVEREIARQSEVSLIREHSGETEGELRRHLQSRLYGLGPLQEFLDDPEVEEIWINEPDRVFIAREWARVLRTVELGQPLGPSLSESARAMGVEEIEALVDHLVQALERGAPLAEVVRAHSSDSRLRQLRAVVDSAGKAGVLMLIPLVMMILPITVIFAVWPSLQALQFSF